MRGQKLCRDQIIILRKKLAPFRMSNQGEVHSQFAHHLCGDFSGVRTRRFAMDILNTHRDTTLPNPAEHRAEINGRRKQRKAGRIGCKRSRQCIQQRATNSSANALEPFIFQFPATSGRRTCYLCPASIRGRQKRPVILYNRETIHNVDRSPRRASPAELQARLRPGSGTNLIRQITRHPFDLPQVFTLYHDPNQRLGA